VLEVIEEAFNRALDREPVDRLDTVYVTELTGCMRRSWYRRKLGYRMTKDMLAGTAVHAELLERVVEELPVAHAEAEKSVEKLISTGDSDVWLVGRVDLFIADGDLRTFVEFKTSDWIFDEHVEQANIYAAVLNVDKFYICYMPKSDEVKCREFSRTWTERDVEERVRKFVESLTKDEPPQKEEDVWCYYCEFKAECKKNKKLF
jgi:CRISPR/Cas system-associated exonuclease Cas4 (RecB family)